MPVAHGTYCIFCKKENGYELMVRADMDLTCPDQEDFVIAQWDDAEDALDAAEWYKRSMKKLGVVVEEVRVFHKDSIGRIYEVYYNDYGEVNFNPEKF